MKKTLKTVSTVQVQNNDMALVPKTIYAKCVLHTTDEGFAVRGEYYTLENNNGVDNFIPLYPRRKINKSWTDAVVNTADGNMTYTETGFSEKFKELGLVAIRNAIVSSGAFSTVAADWEEYTPQT